MKKNLSYYAFISPSSYGVFTNWNMAKQYILGNSGVIHKKFNTKEEAVDLIFNKMRQEGNKSAPHELLNMPLNVSIKRNTSNEC